MWTPAIGPGGDGRTRRPSPSRARQYTSAASRRRRACFCIPAGPPAGPRASRSLTPTCCAHRSMSRRIIHLTPADRSLVVMPLFHVHGLIGATLSTLASGGAVIVPPRFSASEFWELVREHRATWYSAVPTIHQVLLARADSDGAPRQRDALHPLLFVGAGPGRFGQAGESLWRAGPGSVRDDRSGASGRVQPAAALRAQAGHRRTGHPRSRSRSSTRPAATWRRTLPARWRSAVRT